MCRDVSTHVVIICYELIKQSWSSSENYQTSLNAHTPDSRVCLFTHLMYISFILTWKYLFNRLWNMALTPASI